MRKTCVWVSAFRNSVIHKILSEFLQPFRYVGIIRVSPYLLVILIFIWFWDFGCFSQQLFWCFRWIWGLTALAYPHVHLTRSRDGGPSHTGFTYLSIHAWHDCWRVIWMIYLRWTFHGWWGRRAWKRFGMINFHFWRCHGCWSRQCWKRTRW